MFSKNCKSQIFAGSNMNHFLQDLKSSKYKDSICCSQKSPPSKIMFGLRENVSVQYSLCIEIAFEKYKVSFEDLCRNPGIVFDSRLIVLSQGQLYPVRVALPLLMSYSAFLKPLSSEALWKLATEETYRHVHFRGDNASDAETDHEEINTPLAVNDDFQSTDEPSDLPSDVHSRTHIKKNNET